MAQICLVRFHDGKVKPNWGGRATSLALLDILEKNNHVLSGTVPADYIIQGFENRKPTNFHFDSSTSWPISRSRPAAGGEASSEAWKNIGKRAQQLLSNRRRFPAVHWIACQFEQADRIVINGEGDFILTERITLWRTLLLAEIALLLGKQVEVINTILSPGENHTPSLKVARHIKHLFERCERVFFRDKHSLRLASHLFSESKEKFKYSPDALFYWRKFLRRPLLHGPHLEGVPPQTRSALASPYVVISGSSAKPLLNLQQAESDLLRLCQALKSQGLEVVISASCNGDRWMLRAARKMGLLCTPPEIPLLSGFSLLAGARLLVSGRYHPTIMASLVGVPSVYMRSNSHKMTSLQEVLGISAPEEFPRFGDGYDMDLVADACFKSIATFATESRRLRHITQNLAKQAERQLTDNISFSTDAGRVH